jgi:DNA-binding CsgD family transcriptional regulator
MGTAAALAALALVEEQPEAARALDAEALPLYEALGDRHNAGIVRAQLALLAWRAGDQRESAAHWLRALAYAQELGTDAFTVGCLAGVAWLLTARQQPEVAVRLLAAGDRRRAALEQHPFYGPMFRATLPDALAATEAACSPEAFTRAWAGGAALSLEQAVTEALALIEDIAAPPTSPPASAPAERSQSYPAGLSAREVEVLRLIASGQSTRQIAESLVISEGTVERHVTNLYTKIGAHSRAEAAAFAYRHHLVSERSS